MQSVPDIRNQTLNLIDDFILDHIDDFTNEELHWIIDELEDLSKTFYKKFKPIIDDDIEALIEEMEGEE
jgi:hypothetical protein